jgi:DNA-binding MarR family transcriptional regulator
MTSVPAIDPDAMDAWHALLVVHHRLTGAMDEELRRVHGLRLDWYDVLVQLSEAGGRLRMAELADATLFSRTDCTRIVDRMEAAGHVERQPAEEDGRGVYAALTDEGRALLRRASVTHMGSIQRRFVDHLHPDEVRSIAVGLGRMIGVDAD